MNLKAKREGFNKRWNIASGDSYEEAFSKFKTRILNILKDIDEHVNEEDITDFCQYYGIKEVWTKNLYGDHKWSKNIINRLNQEGDEKEFYRLLEVILALNIRSTLAYGGHRYTYSKDLLYQSIVEAIELSDVNVSITTTSDGEMILYPKGEGLLDEELVNSPLSFLNEESAKHLQDALQFYSSKKHIKSAEGLRRCVEEFLRYKLENTRGLAANIVELQTSLKSGGQDSEVRKIIGSVFTTLDQYFNENSKHNDGDIDEFENEFLIYQVGTLLKYVEHVIK